MRRGVFTLALSLVLGPALLAQSAPRETISAAINGKKVEVEYGRPSLKGRSFEELTTQLPADRIWRAGTDQITMLSTEADLMVGGKKVPAGKYSVYIHCPEKGEYSLVLNSVLGQPLGKIFPAAPPNLKDAPWPHFSYQKEIADKEVARAAMKKAAGSNVDLLTYTLKPSGYGQTLTVSWGDQSWAVEIAGVK